MPSSSPKPEQPAQMGDVQLRRAQAELQRLLHAITTRVTRALEKQGLLTRDEENPSLDIEPADDFEQLLGAAVHYRIATGPHAGRKAMTLRTVGPSQLTLTLEDIRHSLGPRREEVTLERTEAVLRQVQTLDPPGVAGSLGECLALQLGPLPADTEWRDAALALVTRTSPPARIEELRAAHDEQCSGTRSRTTAFDWRQLR